METGLDRIRAATWELHEQLEHKHYSRAVLDGSLPRAHYASFLRALWQVHVELERALESGKALDTRALSGPGVVERRALLESDLAQLQVGLDDVDAASLAALVLAQQLRLAAMREPAQLLGFAYVLEGSQLGGLVQAAALEHRAELQGGLRYLTSRGRETRAHFAQFVAGLEPLLADKATLHAAVRGARAAFLGFSHILDAVDPECVEPSSLAMRLNPEAGTHPVPAHLREVEAALRAGEQSYYAVAYYLARYGERGLRYTRSDSAWLVTLARELDEPQTLRQVDWLARVLAARGMPRILLEGHLVQLYEALALSLPALASSYLPLRRASDKLRSERYEALPDFDSLSASFPTSLGDEATISAREAALLLVAAVADEKRGVPKAVTTLTSWLFDPARFSAAWIAALQQLLTQARGPS
ncbi:MAG: hypothetical protein JWN48_5062 [Myxococcaceae bacterium]|nr:hypothetical protein [Myxococcaceae bacterium]